MPLETPKLEIRYPGLGQPAYPTIPTLSPSLPTHVTFDTTRLPLRRLRLSRGLRRHEIVVYTPSTTIFLTPSSDGLRPFYVFVRLLHQLSISPPRYKFTSLLARGAFGSVHAALSATSSRLAVKRVSLSNPFWRAERDILAYLPPHRNVIEVYDTTITNGHLHIVMPHHRTFSSLQTPLPVSHALSLIKSILRGLAHLHSHGISHNDIKPENLLLHHSTPREAVITDLGLATFGAGHGGTRVYAPPERPGQCGDVWGAGVVAVWLLTGRLPWGDVAERRAVVQRLRNGDEVVDEILEGFGEEVVGLVKGLLQVDCRKRLTARAALEHAVFGGGRGGEGWGLLKVFRSVLFGVRMERCLSRGVYRRTLLL